MINNFGLSQEDLAVIIDILCAQPEIESAWIYGSRAKGNFKNGSDIDIALKGDLLNLEIVNHISYLLNEETLMAYQFDIVNYRTITNANLIEHIDRVGIEFYNKSKNC